MLTEPAGSTIWNPSAEAGGARSLPGVHEVACPQPCDGAVDPSAMAPLLLPPDPPSSELPLLEPPPDPPLEPPEDPPEPLPPEPEPDPLAVPLLPDDDPEELPED
jgi:hypothetical protein